MEIKFPYINVYTKYSSELPCFISMENKSWPQYSYFKAFNKKILKAYTAYLLQYYSKRLSVLWCAVKIKIVLALANSKSILYLRNLQVLMAEACLPT